jgi:hypothetical protein
MVNLLTSESILPAQTANQYLARYFTGQEIYHPDGIEEQLTPQ